MAAPPGSRGHRPLWQCPLCGQRFIGRNMSHSCGHHTIEEHFLDCEPVVRELFDTLLEATRSIGPLHVYAQKTRIVFQTRARFVSVTPRRRLLAGHLWLKRPRVHPSIHRVEALLGRDFVHNFRLTDASQLDAGFRELLSEAYAVGSQELSRDGL